MNQIFVSITWLHLMVSMLSFFVVGCHTMTIPNDRVKPVESMPLKVEQQGLLIAIHPVIDEAEIEESFRISLLDKGILPIQVEAINKNPSLSFILSRNKIYVVDRETLKREMEVQARSGRVTSEVPGAGTLISGYGIVTGMMATQIAVAAGATTVALGPIGGLIGLGIMTRGMKMLSDAQVIEHNLAVKQFESHTLGPGNNSTYGYIYFQLPKNEKSNKKYQVLIEATESGTGKAMTFMFPLEY